MRKALIIVAALMFVAGLLLAPAYYFYCTQFSGGQLGKFPLSGRSDMWTLNDGSRQSFPGGRAMRPFSIDLDPAMNPVGFNWHGTVSGMVMRGSERSEYRAWLFLAGRPVMQETFSISRSEKDSGTASQWQAIGRFNVPQRGRYDFVFEEVREPPFSVSGMEIEVRRNVTVPSTPIVIIGSVLIAAGFVLMFVLFRETPEAGSVVAPMPRGTLMVVLGITTLLMLGFLFGLVYSLRDSPSAAVQPVLTGLPPAPPPAASRDTGSIEIQQAEPPLARIGEPITLRGKNFGRAEDHVVSVGGHGMRLELEVIEWRPELIKVRIPNDPRLQMDRSYYYRVDRMEVRQGVRQFAESSNLLMFGFANQK